MIKRVVIELTDDYQLNFCTNTRGISWYEAKSRHSNCWTRMADSQDAAIAAITADTQFILECKRLSR